MAAKTFTPGNKNGTTDGATPVDIVLAPAASAQRMVRTLVVNNKDSAAVTLTVKLVEASTGYTIFKGSLDPDQSWVWGSGSEVLVLDDTDKKVTAVLGGSVAATEPDYTSHYADIS